MCRQYAGIVVSAVLLQITHMHALIAILRHSYMYKGVLALNSPYLCITPRLLFRLCGII